jgi:hypothetical protein
MSCLRFVLVVATLSVAVSSVAYGQRPSELGPPCTFPASEDVVKPIVVGPDSITKRLQVVPPLDAPVRILRADFTGATLTTGGFFRFTSNYSLEVVNVTDQTARFIAPAAYASSRGDSAGEHRGGGGGPTHRIPLGPGQRRVLKGDGVVTEGSLQVDDDVRLRVGISAVKFDTCYWNNFQKVFPFGPGKSSRPDSLDAFSQRPALIRRTTVPEASTRDR